MFFFKKKPIYLQVKRNDSFQVLESIKHIS